MTAVDDSPKTMTAPAASPTRPPAPDRRARSHHLVPGRGVAVLLPDGRQVALFRLPDDGLHAVGNLDPYSGAAVMSRGLTGDRGGEPTVASPLLKQVFSLRDGRALDDEGVTLSTYAVRVVDVGRGGRRPGAAPLTPTTTPTTTARRSSTTGDRTDPETTIAHTTSRSRDRRWPGVTRGRRSSRNGDRC